MPFSITPSTPTTSTSCRGRCGKDHPTGQVRISRAARLARQPHLVAIHAQPFTLHYQDHGRRRRYTPDLLVVFEQVPRHLRRRGFDRWTAIEVKPASRVDAAVIDRLASVARHLGLATACL